MGEEQLNQEGETSLLSQSQRTKNLKRARFFIRIWPLAMLIALAYLGFSVYICFETPGMGTLLKLVSPLGGVLLFGGWHRQARQTIRDDGIEPRNMTVTIGVWFTFLGPGLSQSYQRGNMLIFVLVCALLLLLLLSGLVTWLAGGKQQEKAV